MKNVEITKPGIAAIAVVLAVGFGVLGYSQYSQNQTISHLTRPVVYVPVTPTVVPVSPTATPAASIKTRINTPAAATKGAK